MVFLPRFDRVVALTTPPMVAFSALLFTRLRGGPLIYWMMDLNPDQAIEAGWIRRDGVGAKVLEAVLRLVLKNSGGIVALDKFIKDRVVAKGALEERVKVLPLWAHNGDLETVPHDRNPFRQEHQLQDKFVVMYSGNLSVCHPLDTLLEAARLLKDDPDVVFLFIGGGERVEEVLRYRDREKLSNVIYLEYQPRSKIKYSLSAADVHAVVMGENYPGVVHTCKIYGILKIGRPFIYIGPERSHIGEIMTDSGIGYRIENGNPAGVVEALGEIRRMADDQLAKIHHQSRDLAQNRFSREILARRLVDFILGVE